MLHPNGGWMNSEATGWGGGLPLSLHPLHDKQATCPRNTPTFSAQFLLTSRLWRICMSFLLIRNDFASIVPFYDLICPSGFAVSVSY